MSKLKEIDKKQRAEKIARKDETVINFMAGESFKINPLDTMKMITASSIFGEPSYYRDGGIGTKIRDARYKLNPILKGYAILDESYDEKTTTQIMEETIDQALSYDFKGTLNWAIELRKSYYMRLNPQVIMVRAAVHPGRKIFTKENPGEFSRIEQIVMSRADEPATQMAYYLYMNKGKNAIPTILKKSISRRLENLDRRSIGKYKNHEIGMIDTVRITHAYSDDLDELMKTGTVQLDEDEKTWENLRSGGKSWKEIFHRIKMGHMALLRNIVGVFTEVDDAKFCREYLDMLKSGVKNGKQFPYRYYSALMAVEKSACHHKPQIIDTLEECMDISVENMPKLHGKTMALSDNSGSAWGTITSEYGTTCIAEIDNLSSVIAASCSDEGYVGKFGDKLKTFPISKRKGILSQAKEVSRTGGSDVGTATEGGIWEFFSNAIEKKEHWDNIMIYSDQQAGHGGLYGTPSQKRVYKAKGFSCNHNSEYINVFDLILEYRKKVNPKVNVYSIQTAGYNNVCIPENAYRTGILYGWTGKELIYCAAINGFWDAIDNQKK